MVAPALLFLVLQSMRKPIQIATSLVASIIGRHEGDDGEVVEDLVEHTSVLCDDGSMWYYEPYLQEWRRYPGIPQDQ